MIEPRYAEIRVDRVEPPPHRLRDAFDPAELGALADDIAAQGLLQPIGVCDNGDGAGYTIGFGDRRVEAHKLLKREMIPARIWPFGTDLLSIAVAENHFRADLNPIEDAKGMRQFIERGEPVPHVARRYRCSEATVRARLALLELPEDLQLAVSRRELSVAVAVGLADIDHAVYRASLIEEAQRTGASTRVVNVWVAHYQADRDRIVANHLTVTEIVESRATYVVYVMCEACHVEKPYTDTRAHRFCVECGDQLMAALAGTASAE